MRLLSWAIAFSTATLCVPAGATTLYMACEMATPTSRALTKPFSVRSGWIWYSGADKGLEIERVRNWEKGAPDLDDMILINTYYQTSFTGQFADYAASKRDRHSACYVTTELERMQIRYRKLMADGRYETTTLADWRPTADAFVDVTDWNRIAELRAASTAEPAKSKAKPATPGPEAISAVSAAVPPEVAGKTPKQIEYEAKLAAHQQELARIVQSKAEAEAIKARQREAAAKARVAHDEQMAAYQKVVDHQRLVEDQQKIDAARRERRPIVLPSGDEKVAFKEGVVLCREFNLKANVWSCQGPLQTMTVVLDTSVTPIILGQVCGSDRTIRDLGMVRSYRAFGCGFGIHPTARDYPGNTDVPARLGVDYIPGRGIYYCKASKLAYCR